MTSSDPSITTERAILNSEASEVILKVEGVSKKFAYSLRDVLKYGTLRLFREFLGLPSRSNRLEVGEFWALDDVSFELRRGETLGIIGRNGAGKSTVLKVVNGIFLPDGGRVAVKGTVAGLIEIGAGFQPNLTGRENVYIIASILGMTKEQVDRVFDDIIEFADIGKFMDSPVQSYSSGMIVRLGFAIHVFQKPDVLLADEILAVGDFEFQQKCLEKIAQIKKEVGMILVSHSMPTIVRFCDRAIVLDRGRVLFDGSPKEAVERMMFAEHRAPVVSRGGGGNPALQDPCGIGRQSYVTLSSGSRIPKAVFGGEYCNAQKISKVHCRWAFGRNGPERIADIFSEILVEISFHVKFPDTNLIIGIPVFSPDGQMITAFNTDASGCEIPVDPDGGVFGRLTIPCISLNPGEYVPCLAVVVNGAEFIYREVLEPIRIVSRSSRPEAHSVYFGLYSEKHSWNFSSD